MRGIILPLALLAVAPIGACIGTPACVEPGTTRLGIAEARLPNVSRVRVDGDCTVEALPASCGPGVVCYQGTSGETIATVVVSASKRGKCVVSIDYNDGCTSDEVQYEFVGPTGNCCEDVCAKSRNTEPIAASCPAM